MIWLTIAFTFLSVLVIGMLLFLVLAPASDFRGDRLAQLWHPVSHPSAGSFAEKQRDKLETSLISLGKLLPTSESKTSRNVKLMLRAGIRNSDAVKVLQGMQLLLPLAFFAVVYFTGLYKINVFVFCLAALGAGFLLPDFWLSWKVKTRQKRITLGLPDMLDLLVVCVETGMGLDQALFRVAQEIQISHRELNEELLLLNLEMRVGKSRVDSLRELEIRTGVDDIRAFVVMLIQADRFGTDLAQALRVHSDDLRTKRRQRAEEAAAKTSVKMTFPLVFFIFPAMFAVLLGPAVITIIRQFHIGGTAGP
ncbi:MAG: type II secretion system F family protein [Candidatus Acidiferrales bacterium]